MRTMQQKIRRALLEKADIFAAEAKAGIIGNHGRLVLGAKAEALRDFAKYELDAFFPEEDSPMTADDYRKMAASFVKMNEVAMEAAEKSGQAPDIDLSLLIDGEEDKGVRAFLSRKPFEEWDEEESQPIVFQMKIFVVALHEAGYEVQRPQ